LKNQTALANYDFVINNEAVIAKALKKAKIGIIIET
jgi:hypothetical protein